MHLRIQSRRLQSTWNQTHSKTVSFRPSCKASVVFLWQEAMQTWRRPWINVEGSASSVSLEAVNARVCMYFCLCVEGYHLLIAKGKESNKQKDSLPWSFRNLYWLITLWEQAPRASWHHMRNNTDSTVPFCILERDHYVLREPCHWLPINHALKASQVKNPTGTSFLKRQRHWGAQMGQGGRKKHRGNHQIEAVQSLLGIWNLIIMVFEEFFFFKKNNKSHRNARGWQQWLRQTVMWAGIIHSRLFCICVASCHFDL